MSSRGESSRLFSRKQRSLSRRKAPRLQTRARGKFTSEETSSPVAVPTATEKKLALSTQHSSSMDIAVSPLVKDGASSSLCEMKGLRLIDLGDLLASVTRRASCNVCGSGLTVRENLKNRRGLCTKLPLSCTNPLCAGVEDAFSDTCKHSKV